MAELDALRTQMRDGKTQTDLGARVAQLAEAQLAAGFIPIAGPGVTVTLNDSTRPATPGENPNNFIIHDEDILRVKNELAVAGAEALAINGQRLTGRSEIRCVGPVVTVNGIRTTVPVIVTAVGDPAALEPAIARIAEELKPWGIQVSVKREARVTVPAYRGSLKLPFPQPGAPAEPPI